MSSIQSSFGRIDEAGNVFVNDNGTERLIGSQPTMSHEEAIHFYTKRYEDFASTVRLLEQRLKAKADSRSIYKSAVKTLTDLEVAAAIGDLQSLRNRVQTIISGLADEIAKFEAERSANIETALAEREKIAAEAEKIVSTDPKKINFKQTSARMNELFESWQQLQKSGVKVPKGKADAIWHRFSKARNSFETIKRNYFSTQDQLAKASKSAKTELVTKAEALVEKGAEAAADYKSLLESWKKLPGVKSKADDALWTRFKAAGDAIYAKRAEKIASENVEFAANLEVKKALLVEAEAIEVSANLEAAKQTMKSIQSRWEKAGKVPRESIRSIEDRLKAVERKIREAEAEIWRKSDPATIQRTNSMRSQLEEAISKLESELKEAEKSGNADKIQKAKEALETKKAWLAVVVAD